MPFCPSCHYEYKEGVQECPDCKEELVDRLPEEQEKEAFVGLYSLPGEVYAAMVKEALEKENIDCVMRQDVVGSGLLVKGTDISGGQYQIFVRKKDFDRASDILHNMMDHI